MIINEKMIVLNYPKTGSTFVRKMIEEVEKMRGNGGVKKIKLYRKKGKISYIFWLVGISEQETVLIQTSKMWSENPADEHGGVSQIPWGLSGRPIACAVRNPLDRMVSSYHFRWYAKYPDAPIERVRDLIPSFPDMTFEEYVLYANRLKGERMRKRAGIAGRNDIGLETILFVRMLFRKPSHVLRCLSDEFVQSGRYKAYLPSDLHLLKTETLNQDLVSFLRSRGYSKEETQFIEDHKKVQPGPGTRRSPKDDWRSHYTTSLLEEVLQQERFVFRILEDLGVSYDVSLTAS